MMSTMKLTSHKMSTMKMTSQMSTMKLTSHTDANNEIDVTQMLKGNQLTNSRPADRNMQKHPYVIII